MGEQVNLPGNQPESGRYDHLFDPTHDMSQAAEAGGLAVAGALGVETAAVRATSSTEHAGNYMGPPTDAQIANASKYGFDLSQQKKYFSEAEWANRNNVK